MQDTVFKCFATANNKQTVWRGEDETAAFEDQDNRRPRSVPAKINHQQQMTRRALENTGCSSKPQEDQLPRGDLYVL